MSSCTSRAMPAVARLVLLWGVPVSQGHDDLLVSAVWAAYGWEDGDPAETADEAILERLLALNQARAAR